MIWNFMSARSWVFRDRSLPARRGPFRGWIEGLKRALKHPRATTRAMWLAPLVTGLIALLLGQDSNSDLLNYHFYNPYALLNGRIGTDLAAAQFQSYFNPLLDVPYYAMVTHWPAMAAGFVMGAVHGLNFVLLLCIVRLVLETSDKGNSATAILLSLAGCLGPAFLSELGNTMGDNTTAVFVLSALALVIWQLPRIVEGGPPGAITLVAGGLLMGAGVGLKLTNAVYAVALCLSLLALPVPWLRRPVIAFTFGVGVLVGIAATSGYWFAILLQSLWESTLSAVQCVVRRAAGGANRCCGDAMAAEKRVGGPAVPLCYGRRRPSCRTTANATICLARIVDSYGLVGRIGGPAEVQLKVIGL